MVFDLISGKVAGSDPVDTPTSRPLTGSGSFCGATGVTNGKASVAVTVRFLPILSHSCRSHRKLPQARS